ACCYQERSLAPGRRRYVTEGQLSGRLRGRGTARVLAAACHGRGAADTNGHGFREVTPEEHIVKRLLGAVSALEQHRRQEAAIHDEHLPGNHGGRFRSEENNRT